MANILFVCKGNTRRSPIAKALLEARGGTGDSAGIDVDVDITEKWGDTNITRDDTDNKQMVSDLKSGTPLARPVSDVCTDLGISTPTGYVSKTVTQALIDWADTVYYMDAAINTKLVAIFGASAKFTALDGTSNIPDWDAYYATVGETEDNFALFKEEGKHIKRCVDLISI